MNFTSMFKFVPCLLFALLFAGIDDVDAINLLELAEQNGAKTFVKYLHQTGLADILMNDTETLTVFVPTDEAFEKIPENVNDSMSDKGFVRKMMEYHIAQGRHHSKAFHNDMEIKSLQKYRIRINMYGLPSAKIVTATGSIITKFDLNATNGIMFVVDRVMYLWPELGKTYAIIGFVPYLQYMYYGIYHANLTDMIMGGEPYTIFAPVDPAFQQLPAGFNDHLRNNHTALREVMLNHIVKGTYFSEPFQTGERIKTLNNEQHTVAIYGSNITVDDALLILPDFTATNGVVHLTNKVWVPPGFDLS